MVSLVESQQHHKLIHKLQGGKPLGEEELRNCGAFYQAAILRCEHCHTKKVPLTVTDTSAEATGSQELAVVSGTHGMQMEFTRVNEQFEAVEIEPMTTLQRKKTPPVGRPRISAATAEHVDSHVNTFDGILAKDITYVKTHVFRESHFSEAHHHQLRQICFSWRLLHCRCCHVLVDASPENAICSHRRVPHHTSQITGRTPLPVCNAMISLFHSLCHVQNRKRAGNMKHMSVVKCQNTAVCLEASTCCGRQQTILARAKPHFETQQHSRPTQNNEAIRKSATCPAAGRAGRTLVRPRC